MYKIEVALVNFDLIELGVNYACHYISISICVPTVPDACTRNACDGGTVPLINPKYK